MRKGLGLLILAAAGCRGGDALFLEVNQASATSDCWIMTDPEGMQLVREWISTERRPAPGARLANLGNLNCTLYFSARGDETFSRQPWDQLTLAQHGTIKDPRQFQSEESLQRLIAIFEKHGRRSSPLPPLPAQGQSGPETEKGDLKP